MKTREELYELARELFWETSDDFDSERAVQILDDLHSEGMRDSAEIADLYLQSMGSNDGMKVASLIKENILVIIKNKTPPKPLPERRTDLPN